MDLNQVKNGNDFLMQMFNEQQAEGSVNPANEDVNAGAVAPSVDQTTDTTAKGSDSDLELVDDSNATESQSTDQFIDLDGDDSPASTVQETKFDFAELGKALQVEGIDSKDGLVAKWKEISQKTKEYEDKLAAYSSIPEPLREAIELANRGGDYLEYLGISTIDYDAVDDRSLVEEELIELGIFNNADGSINEEALGEYVDGLNEREMQVRGAQVRNKYKQHQLMQRQEVQRKAEEQKQRAINDMRQALDSIENVGPFKLNQARKKELFDSFASGQMLKELFQDKNGKFDYKKAAEVYFRAKYAPKIDKVIADSARTKTIKEQANEIKNIDLGGNNRLARPEVQQEPSPLDLYMNKLKGIK